MCYRQTCDYTNDVVVIRLLEDAFGGTIAPGDVGGLQWSAEIIDTASVRDEDGEQVDFESSADVEVEGE